MDIIDWSKFFAPYKQVVDELIIKMNGISSNYIFEGKNSPIISVSGRVKSIDSLLEKSIRKNVPFTEEEYSSQIEDIAGVRVICRFVEDIYTIVNLIKAREDFDIKIIKEKDFISTVKPSGYRSYHLIVEYPIIMCNKVRRVKAEIQIRTMAMDFWATIEHSLKYKYKENIPEYIKTKLVNSANASSQVDIEMSKIRDEILESVEVKKLKQTIVNEIMINMRKIFNNKRIEEANMFGDEFIDVYQSDSLERLRSFNDQLKLTILMETE